MEQRKLFSQMSPAEQDEYRNELLQFISDGISALSAEQTTADAVKARREALKMGFSLATAFSFCRDFVSEKLMFGDTGDSTCQKMLQYFEEIKKQVLSSVAVSPAPTSISEKKDGSLPQRHRGRPTKTEAKEYKEAVEKKKAKEASVSPSMFPHNPDKNEVAGVEFTLSMQQYKWLLSADLQHDVDGLRDYRTAFSDASQKAKFLAEQGAKADEVAMYAEEAKQMNALIEGIYQQADMELAEVCVRLKYDPHYTKMMAEKKVNTEDMRLALLPYLRKQAEDFKQKVIDKIHSEDPKLAKERKALADAKDRVDAVRKYLLRTDKPATEKRISTMEKRIEELRKLDKKFPSLKIEPDAYLPVLEKTKETWELSLKNT